MAANYKYHILINQDGTMTTDWFRQCLLWNTNITVDSVNNLNGFETIHPGDRLILTSS